MTIAFTNLFTALGKVVGGLNEWNTARGSTLTSRVSTLRTNIAAVDTDIDDTLTSNASGAVSSGDSWPGYLAQLANDLIIAAVLADRPQTDTSFTACLTELVRQMGVASESLNNYAATVGSVTAVGSPTGTPTFVTAQTDPYTQSNSNFTLPDVYIISTSAEGFQVQGKNADTSPTQPTWPSGNGVNTIVTQIDASTDSIGSDPGFELWDTGPPATPTQWMIVSGTAGTTVAQATDTPITGVGTYALQLQGDAGTGATPLRVRQQVTVSANEVYFIHCYMKRTANPANTGTLTVALRDSSGNVLSGTSNISVATGSIATSWTAVTATLATPTNLPSDGLVYLEIRYNAGNGDTVRVDQVALNLLPALSPVGVRLAIVRGATASVVGDVWTWTITRSSPTASLIRGIDRLLSLTSYTVRIPTSGSPTQADALVS